MHHRALVGLRMRYIDEIGCGTGRTDHPAQPLDHPLPRRLHFGRIVADADDLVGLRGVCGGNRPRLRHHRQDPRLARDVRAIAVADHPVLFGIDPQIKTAFLDQAHDLIGHLGVDRMTFDHVEVRIDDQPPVEPAQRQLQAQRFDQHAHAMRWPGTRQRKPDAAQVKRSGRGDCSRGQHFVGGYDRAIDIGQQQGNGRGADHAARPCAGVRGAC